MVLRGTHVLVCLSVCVYSVKQHVHVNVIKVLNTSLGLLSLDLRGNSLGDKVG